MIGYIIKRVWQTVITLFIILTLLFFLFRMVPGDPASMILDPRMTPEAKELLRRQFGLDKPLWMQYLLYLKNVFQGNFGRSFQAGRPVFEIIKEKLPATLLLFTSASILSFILGMRFGKVIAWRRGSVLEAGVTLFGLMFYTVFLPWFGMLMIWIFSYKLGLFPLGGMVSPEIWIKEGVSTLTKALDILHHLFLPLSVLTLTMFAGSMLIMRSSMLEILGKDYITTARSKGVQEKVVRDKHAARNAMLPLTTSFALSLAFSMSGGVLTETVFSWPGLGSEIVEAVLNQDFPLAQAAFLLIAFIVLGANLVADILYVYLDPRIRY
jgi:peptide/nickel transport system permease protein